MRQVLQEIKNGDLLLQEVPAPAVRQGHVLIETRCSLISAGTERMVTSFGRASYLEKARRHPDKVKQVLDKVRTDGLAPTIEAVPRGLGLRLRAR